MGETRQKALRSGFRMRTARVSGEAKREVHRIHRRKKVASKKSLESSPGLSRGGEHGLGREKGRGNPSVKASRMDPR